MDETETKNSNDEIILKEELDININDLFTIDFKNLKIFLTTILKNQNKISQKMNVIESNITNKEKKNDKNFSILNKKIKAIEQNFSINSDKLDDLKKELDLKENKEPEEEQEIPDREKNKEDTEYLISNSNMEIITSKRNEYQSNNNANINIEKEEDKEKENEDNKEPEKEIKNEIINKEPKPQTNKKPRLTEKEIKEMNNAISEEDSNVKSESEKDLSDTKRKVSIKEVPKNIQERKYEDPYRNVEIRKYSNYTIDELLTKFPNLLNDFDQLKGRVNFIEKKFKTAERGSKLISFKSMDNTPEEDMQYLKLQIKDLQTKNDELLKERDNMKKEIEELQVKMKDLNIIEILQDSKLDQGNMDVTKALVMTLEQKVFKKTGLIDEKIKRLEESMNKLEVDQKNVKNLAEILKLSNEDIKRMIKNLEEIENKNAEDTLTLSNDVNDIMNDIKKLKEFEAKTNETIKNNQLLIDKIDKNVTKNGKRIKEIDEILEDYEPQKPGIDKQQFHKFKNEVNEGIRDLKRKNADMEKEIEYLKKHPDLLKAIDDVKKLQKEIVVKVNKTDFLDLKDKFNMQNIDIINLNDTVDKIQETTNKTKNEIGFFLKRLESLSAQQVSTRTALNELIKKQQDLIIDSSKYLELTAFDKFLLGLQKEKENTDNNFASVNKLLTEMAEALKSKSGAEDMKLFEQLMNNKLEELKLYTLRKLADKIETNRNIKYLDSQIRHIIDFYIKKTDKVESWLIAKKPLGGYSCASCESYLGDLKNNTKEFTPWSKYPNREDKNYRYGNGFSRMLNMLNVDFKNQLDAIKDNAYESDHEGRNSADPKSPHNRRFSKNLSSANVFNTHINSRNSITNTTNKNDVFPKISVNKAPENNSNNNSNSNLNNNEFFSVDNVENGRNMGNNESTILINENEKMKENTARKSDEPHVIKIYRKNKYKNIEINKKD